MAYHGQRGYGAIVCVFALCGDQLMCANKQTTIVRMPYDVTSQSKAKSKYTPLTFKSTSDPVSILIEVYFGRIAFSLLSRMIIGVVNGIVEFSYIHKSSEMFRLVAAT